MLRAQLCRGRILLGGAVFCVTAALAVNAGVPRGWILAGSKPAEYEVGVDTDQAHQGHASAFLKSKKLNVDGFGTLMQLITAEKYRGNKVRLSGLVKSEEVSGWAGLWHDRLAAQRGSSGGSQRRDTRRVWYFAEWSRTSLAEQYGIGDRGVRSTDHESEREPASRPAREFGVYGVATLESVG